MTWAGHTFKASSNPLQFTNSRSDSFQYHLDLNVCDNKFHANKGNLDTGSLYGTPDSINFTYHNLPEPSTFALLGLGLRSIFAARRQYFEGHNRKHARLEECNT